MIPLILLGGLALYLIARSSASSEASDASSAPEPSSSGFPGQGTGASKETSPPPPAGTNLVTSESGSTTNVKSESLSFGDESGGGVGDAAAFGAALDAFETMFGNANGYGTPISGMSDVLGGGTRQATSAEVQTPRVLPAGAHIAPDGSADAPVESGTRVTFSVDGKDTTFGRLEGTYAGPSDPSAGPAFVYVDRIAVRPGEASELLPFGRYTISASSKSGYSDTLDRVVWEAVDPESVGLKKFSSPPTVSIGEQVPLVVRDLYGNIAIAVTVLRSISKSGDMSVTLDHAWKQQAFKDQGFGSPVFPREISQATLTAPASWILDMSKM